MISSTGFRQSCSDGYRGGFARQNDRPAGTDQGLEIENVRIAHKRVSQRIEHRVLGNCHQLFAGRQAELEEGLEPRHVAGNEHRRDDLTPCDIGDRNLDMF